MPLLLLLILALTVGLATGLLVWRLPRSVAASPAVEGAQKVGETIGRHGALHRALKARLDPAAATGLALTLALLVVIGGGVLFALLAYLVRSNAHLHGVDNGVAKWGSAHASAFSTDGLNVVTQFGGTYVVIALAVVLAVGLTIIDRSAWVIPFVIAVMGGEEILTLTVKDLADRVRPTFNPAAASLGPSFPSGHSATAAAFYACPGAPDRPPMRTTGAGRAHRPRRRSCRRGRGEPRVARCALAHRRDRRPRARLGLVLRVRSRLRRAPVAFRGGR